MIEEPRSIAKLMVQCAIYGLIVGAAYLLYDAVTVGGAPLWQWIGSIVVLLVLVPTVINAIRFRRLSPEQRQARLAALQAKVDATGAVVDRYDRLHASTKYKNDVLRDGIEGTALILAIGDGGRASEIRTLVGLELEVRLPARSYYPVETGEWITAMSAGSIAPGRELVVKVDRHDPNRVAVDWDASLRLR